MSSPNLEELKESLRQLDRNDRYELLLMLANEHAADVDEPLEGVRIGLVPIVRASKSTIDSMEAMVREAQANG